MFELCYKCYKFVAFRGIITKGAAIFLSCIYIRGMFPSTAGKHREVAIVPTPSFSARMAE